MWHLFICKSRYLELFCKIVIQLFSTGIFLGLMSRGPPCNFTEQLFFSAPWKLPPEKFPPRKLPPMKIAPYENTHLWKFPPLKIAPLKIAPKKITPTKLTPRKLSPMKVATIVVRNWKLLPCGPYVVMKNKAWWPVWWSRVSWKYRYLFNLTWIVVFLWMSNSY